MEIEAKRLSEEKENGDGTKRSKQDLENLFLKYYQAYANMGIMSIDSLQDRIHLKEESMHLVLTQDAINTFVYLSVFPSLKELTLSKENVDTSNHLFIGEGLDDTSITSLTIRCKEQCMWFNPTKAEKWSYSAKNLKRLTLNCCVKPPASINRMNSFELDSLEELTIGDRPAVYSEEMESNGDFLFRPMNAPSLKYLILINMKNISVVSVMSPMPPIESIDIQYCLDTRKIGSKRIETLKRLRFYHCDSAYILSSITFGLYPALEQFTMEDDPSVTAGSGWKNEKHETSMFIEVPPSLRILNIRHIQYVSSITVEHHLESRLEKIDLGATTSDLRIKGAFFKHLSIVVVKNEYFPFDILTLPFLIYYEGSYAIQDETLESIAVLDDERIEYTAFNRGLIQKIAKKNPSIVFVSHEMGLLNVSEEVMLTYNMYKTQYQAMGFTTLEQMYLWKKNPTIAADIQILLTPLMIRDFTYLAFFARFHIQAIAFYSNGVATDEFQEVRLGPHLQKSLPDLKTIAVLSESHVLTDIDDAFLLDTSSILRFVLGIKMAFSRKIILSHVLKLELGVNTSIRHVSELNDFNAPICTSVAMNNIEHVASLLATNPFPEVVEMVIQKCNFTNFEASHSTPHLKILHILEGPLVNLPTINWERVFPELKTLIFQDTLVPLIQMQNTVAEIDSTYRFIERLEFLNVCVRGVHILNGILPMALQRLSFYAEQMPDPGTAELTLQDPAVLPQLISVKWFPRSGYFPFDVFRRQAQYEGTYVINPAMIPLNRVINMDAFATNSLHDVRLIRDLRQANPTVQLHSSFIIERPQQVIRRFAGRQETYFKLFHHDLICGRKAFWENASFVESLKPAVEAVEMVANADAKEKRDEALFQRILARRRGEAVGELPPTVNEMEKPKADLLQTIATFNATHLETGIHVTYEDDFLSFFKKEKNPLQAHLDILKGNGNQEEAIRHFNANEHVFKIRINEHGDAVIGKEWRYQVISPYYNTTCPHCALPFYLTPNSSLPSTNDEIFALFHANEKIWEADDTGEGKGVLVVCNYTEMDYRLGNNVRNPSLLTSQINELATKQCGHMKHFAHAFCFANYLRNNRIRRCIHTREQFY